jgi:TrwC relaxase
MATTIWRRARFKGNSLGALADEWGLREKAILKGDSRFRSFAVLDIATLSGQNLKRPRKSERQAMEFVYSGPKSVSIVAVLDERIGEQMSMAVKEELKWFDNFSCCRDRRGELYNCVIIDSPCG